METMYFVDYKRHNATTGGWAYKTELGTKSLSEAKKKYHALLAEYEGGETFDFVSVTLSDMRGNKIMSEYWPEEND